MINFITMYTYNKPGLITAVLHRGNSSVLQV